MQKEKFLELLDDLLNLPAGTLKGSDLLEANDWSSVSALGLMALGDEQFNVLVEPSMLSKCRTVDDIVALFPDAIVA